jgi:hypothetical protein
MTMSAINMTMTATMTANATVVPAVRGAAPWA